MPNEIAIVDIIKLFEKQFNAKPYVVPGILEGPIDSNGYNISEQASVSERELTKTGNILKEKYHNIEVLLPVRLFDSGELLIYLPFVVIKISGNKTIIRTPLSERVGSVKEQFNTDDYKIDIKGFLIGADRKWPEAEIEALKRAYETQKALTIDNAITNVFLSDKRISDIEQRRVVITGFDMPDVSGGKEHVRPFSMTLESDAVFILELEK